MNAELIAGAMQAVPGADNDTANRVASVVDDVLADQRFLVMAAMEDESSSQSVWLSKRLTTRAVREYRKTYYGGVLGFVGWMLVKALVVKLIEYYIRRKLGL